MTDPHTRKRPIARGCRDPRFPGYLGIVVRLDEETFQQVRDLAERRGTSFGEQVRTLIEWGLEADA